jgi:hypothetical protein
MVCAKKARDEQREQDNGQGIIHDRPGLFLLGLLFALQVGIATKVRTFHGLVGRGSPTTLPSTTG